MGDLIGEVLGLLVDLVFGGGGSGRGRRRRARQKIDEGTLRCYVRMVTGRIPGLTREWADVELELSAGAVTCRRRDDRQRAIQIGHVTLDHASRRATLKGDPLTSSDDHDEVWTLITPTVTLEVFGARDLLLAAEALVHPAPATR